MCINIWRRCLEDYVPTYILFFVVVVVIHIELSTNCVIQPCENYANLQNAGSCFVWISKNFNMAYQLI